MSGLPPIPGLDDLPPELAHDDGLLRIRAVDLETGDVKEAPVTRVDVTTGLAGARRASHPPGA